MNYQDFCGNESMLPTPYIRVVTKISKWEKYECIEINGFKFIYGSSIKNTESNLFEYKEIDNSSFFWALMTLYSKLSPDIFTYTQSAGNAAITDNDVKLILHFCKVHGLPFWNKKLDAAPFTNISNEEFFNDSSDKLDEMQKNILRSVIPYSQFNLFPISSLAVGLMSLRSDFLRIISYYGWENLINISLLLTPKDKKILSKMEYGSFQSSKHTDINLYTPSLIGFTTQWDNQTLSLRLNCENLLHLSAYHLCLLMQSGTLGSGIIKTCPKCHKQFVANRRNQTFCHNPCTPQSFHMQKKRNNNSTEGK